MTARLALLAMIAVLPQRAKAGCYRLFFGYRIGRGVRIGFSFLDVASCDIDDDVSIGHLNVIRGGDSVRLGPYSEVLRMNEINSIPEPRLSTPANPRFELGRESSITTGHKIDFTDRVEIGRRTVLGGRNSSIWTHNRQETKPITIGSWAYVGSEIRMAPGSALPSRCVVGMASVVTRALTDEYTFIAGVPAKVIRPLDDHDRELLNWRWRTDLPDEA